MAELVQRGKASPDPLHGSVGMSALWATMEEATLSPKAHMALLDGPERNSRGQFIMRSSKKLSN